MAFAVPELKRQLDVIAIIVVDLLDVLSHVVGDGEVPASSGALFAPAEFGFVEGTVVSFAGSPPQESCSNDFVQNIE